MTKEKERTAQLNLSALMKNFIRNHGVIVIFLLLFVLATVFVKNFFAAANLLNIVKQSAIPVVACIGMTMVLKTGGIDLSLGYIIGFTSSCVGIFIKVLELPIFVSIILTLLIGLGWGLVNGFIVQGIKVPAFITTLGSGYIIFGLAQIISGGTILNKLPDEFLAIGSTNVLGLNTTVIIAAAMAILAYILLQKTVYGRSLSAYGYNKDAAFISGIRTGSLNISVYAISGFFAALAGMLLTIRVNCAQPDMGGGQYTFQIVTAAIIGGASLFGGKGSIVGSVFGVFIIKIIENCINITGVPYQLYQAVMGIVILLSLIFESVKNKRL